MSHSWKLQGWQQRVPGYFGVKYVSESEDQLVSNFIRCQSGSGPTPSGDAKISANVQNLVWKSGHPIGQKKQETCIAGFALRIKREIEY
jgi:hypothetical protein